MRVHAVLVVPALPLRLAAAGAKWATERIGPAAWVILVPAALGGIHWYRKQPPERRERIKEVASDVGTHKLRGPARPPDQRAGAGWVLPPTRPSGHPSAD